jgi:hypothetical protein
MLGNSLGGTRASVSLGWQRVDGGYGCRLVRWPGFGDASAEARQEVVEEWDGGVRVKGRGSPR